MAQHGVTVMRDTLHISGVVGGGQYNAGDTVYVLAYVYPGCTFTRWTGDYTSGDNPFVFTMPDTDVYLYAEGSGTRYDYTITYHDNGGSGSPSPQYKYAGQTLTLSTTVPYFFSILYYKCKF